MNRPLLMIDYDGVVVDSLDLVSMALIEACRRIGLDSVTSEQDVLELFQGNVFERLRALGAGDDGIAEIKRRTAQTVRNASPWLKPFPLMPQLLDELGDSCHIAVVSSSDEDVIWAFLHRHKVTGVAEVAGSQAGESKVVKMKGLMHRFPDQRLYWFVADTAGDVREALIAGATPCGVAWGWHDPDMLVEAGAAVVAETPSALVEILAPEQTDDFWD